jgi:gliding motility-associated-like protein
MTSNAACATTPAASSNTIAMTASSVTPTVVISASSTSICAGQSVTFTATATNGGTTPAYQWKVNGINAGANTATFTSNTLVDADQVSLVMTSNAACATTTTASSNTIAMTASSVIATASSPDIPCGQATGTISINATNGSFPFTYSINGTNYQASNVFSNLNPGSYAFKIKDNVGCTVDITAILKSENTPALKITDPPASCFAIDITVPGISTGSDAGLTYSYWSNASATNALSNPNAIKLSGTYYIKGATPTGCFDIKPVTILINASPVVLITNPPVACEPVTVDLTSSSITTGSDVGLNYTYWNDTAATIALANPNAVSKTGIYFISGKTAAGCFTIKPVAVTMISKVDGLRYSPVTAIPNIPLNLYGRIIAVNYSYQWSPGDGLNFSTIKDPIFKYDKTTEFIIKMTSEQGCITVDTLLVKINSLAGVGPNLFVPKAWSPNGDGHNDYLFPFAVNIKELKYFRIFNRWGQLMFETNEILKGWDGRLNGRKQPMEVYSWTAEAMGMNGEKIQLAGNSVLLQ